MAAADPFPLPRASVLRDLGLAEASGMAVPLLSFNAGVEVGQLAVAAVAVPSPLPAKVQPTPSPAP